VWKKESKTTRMPKCKCPACKSTRDVIDPAPLDFSSGRAPAFIGNNNHIKAQDMAAEMVMKEHGMTDIKGPTDVRAGESQMPKLAPHLQTQVDNFFAPNRQPIKNAGLVARNALSGGYADKSTVATIQQAQKMCDHKFDNSGEGMTRMTVIPKE